MSWSGFLFPECTPEQRANQNESEIGKLKPALVVFSRNSLTSRGFFDVFSLFFALDA